jgi:1,4-alpha-glucan branching enzyme
MRSLECTPTPTELWVRSLQPGARSVAVLDAKTGKQVAELAQVEVEGVEGFFEGIMPRRRNSFPYRLRISWARRTGDR